MAAFPDALLDEDEARAVRVVALALVADATAQRERLSQSDDPEALHDFRVAIRRLRSWMHLHRPVLGRSAPKRALRWLRRLASASNHGRYAEVLLEWLNAGKGALSARHRVGLAWLVRRLTLARTAAAADVAAAVARDFDRARELLESRLPSYRLLMHVHEGARVATFAGATSVLARAQAVTLRRRLDAVRSDDDAEGVHRARIAGKRLRYLLEPIVPHVAEGGATLARLKRLQDALGDLHDAHVWQGVLAAALDDLSREEANEAEAAAAKGAEGAERAEGDLRRARARSPRAGVLALIAQLQERRQERFARVQRDWSGVALAPFFDGVEAIAAELDLRARSGVEIERKYLLRGLPPNMPPASLQEIAQGYLPGRRLVERIRRVREDDAERYYRTVKLGAGMVRTEVEEACSREVFEALWALTEGRRVHKRRHVVAQGTLHWEIDEFTDRDLVLAEIELPSVDLTAELPAWLLAQIEREVTGEAEYVNANLAS